MIPVPTRKKQAKKLLSQFLKDIASEKTEAVSNPDGLDKIITKAEALARILWEMALGKLKTVNHRTGVVQVLPPDRDAIQIIYERLEGKIGTSENVSKEDNIPEKISQSGIEKVNEAATSSLTSKRV